MHAKIPNLPIPLAADQLQVAAALALLWTYRTSADVYNLLRQLDWKRQDGRPFTQDSVRSAVAELGRLGVLDREPRRDGYLRLRDDFRMPLYRYVLDTYPAARLRDAVYRLEGYSPNVRRYYWPLNSAAGTVAVLRISLFSGMEQSEFIQLLELIGRSQNIDSYLTWGFDEGYDPEFFYQYAPAAWDSFLYRMLTRLALSWAPSALPACDWAIAKLDQTPDLLSEGVRVGLADLLVQQGDGVRLERALEGLESGVAHMLRAGRLVLEGKFAEAKPLAQTAVKLRQAELRARKVIFPPSLSWFYPLALLAQPTPANLELARKYCIAESGLRVPDKDEAWGLWVHVANVRLGLESLDRQALLERLDPGPEPGLPDLWGLLLAAWVGPEALAITAKQLSRLDAWVQTLRQRLLECRFQALVEQVDSARAILGGGVPAPGFFVSGAAERWRELLGDLQALAEGSGPVGAKEGGTRILWSLQLGEQGTLVNLRPLEQKRGVRGWNKPKDLTLARFMVSKDLSPWDAKITPCLRPIRQDPRRFSLDRAEAIMALVGHPLVVLADQPDQLIELVEGAPWVEVARSGPRYQVRIDPLPHPQPVPYPGPFGDETSPDGEALRFIILVRDSPQRLRVIRLNEIQRRAAQLIGRQMAVPADGEPELQRTLRALAPHFQVLGEGAQAGREVVAESRLRAELAPAGEDLTLRLVAAPLGPAGPRLAPASGRARIMAAIDGEALGTRRDLQAERGHLESVLDALPFLEDPDQSGVWEWLLTDPEQALAAVEALPGLPGVAGVDWPKGKSVRVVTLGPAQLAMKVTSDRDWFRVSGQARLDEQWVIQFKTLLDAARGASRFIPLGDGLYAALTRGLKTRLAELAQVGELGAKGAQVPRLAATWLAETLDGLATDWDAGFVSTLDRLRAAQELWHPVPGALQASLRPYQEDGYQWAMRLADAGLGGILADDMGLGKTIQALGLLLARGPQGPALVVAPTSVCGNWLAEARRFAPSLNAALYGEGDREGLLNNAGPMDLVIVSYTLLQQAGERFAARTWHTLVADEAQAIKNAAAKRTQAVFDIGADFRLALSGTPVENRLGDLWSIMRFANPGLLASQTRFNERFAAPIERNRDRDAQHLLRRLIGPFVLRRTKGQVLEELPARTELVLSITPDAAERAHYEALRRQAMEEMEQTLETGPVAAASFNILAQLTRLRRAACDPRLVTAGLPLVGAKVQAFAELAAELVANGHKALVFSQFVDFLSLLREPLDAAGIRYQYLDGSTPSATRTRDVAAFQAGEGDLFLISLKAGGFGLNLTAADYVVITDPWWNPAAEDQASGRAHRIGQQRPVTLYRLVTQGTIEEQIIDLHHDKRALAEGVLAEGDAVALPSSEELLALIRGR